MMNQALSTTTQERLTKLGLMGLFTALLAAFAPSREKRPLTLSPLDFTMLSLAVFRLGRMTAFDKVVEPIREPFAETVEDESGAGMTTEATGSGPRKVLGELLTCPICAGTWIAAGLVYGLRILPSPTRLLIAIFSAAGATEIASNAVDAMHWTAQRQRRASASDE
jgi:hypothetical protein